MEGVQFTVKGRPPRKYASESGWGKKEACYIVRLREEALKARTEYGINECFRGPVKLDLTIYAPNIMNKIAPDHVGDLDAMIAGVCESLQAAHPSAPLSLIFKGKEEVNPRIPVIIYDDSQVVSIVAKKMKSDRIYYTVRVEPQDF